MENSLNYTQINSQKKSRCVQLQIVWPQRLWVWSAPIGWFNFDVSALWTSGLLASCFPAPVVYSLRRCEAWQYCNGGANARWGFGPCAKCRTARHWAAHRGSGRWNFRNNRFSRVSLLWWTRCLVDLLSNLVFEACWSCGDLVWVCGFNSVFERDACDNFGEIVKAA